MTLRLNHQKPETHLQTELFVLLPVAMAWSRLAWNRLDGSNKDVLHVTVSKRDFPRASATTTEKTGAPAFAWISCRFCTADGFVPCHWPGCYRCMERVESCPRCRLPVAYTFPESEGCGDCVLCGLYPDGNFPPPRFQ